MAVNNADSIFDLATKHIKGDGVEKNLSKAVELLFLAANAGHDRAQFSLGVMHLNGIGCEKNQAQAIDWLEKSSRQGNLQAADSLSKLQLGVDGANQTSPVNQNEVSMDVNKSTQDVAASVAPNDKGNATLGWIIIASFVFVLYKGYHYFFVSEVDTSKLTQRWECTQVDGTAKGQISNFQFDSDGRFSWISYPEHVRSMSIHGDYRLGSNEITMDNMYTVIIAPGLNGQATRSKFTFVWSITKLNNNVLNFEATSPKFTQQSHYECKNHE